MITIITTMNVGAVDLNLLVVLSTVLSEGTVTRAARKLGVTQPAVSNALARLRRLLDDPLLVRGPRGMVPTPRAQQLAAPVGQAIAQLEAALSEGARFEPAVARRTFTLATTDYGQLTILPRLLPALRARAPHAKLRSVSFGVDATWRALAAGDVDLCLGFFDDAPPSHFRQKLFSDEMICLVRQGHPRVKGRMSLERFLELEHLLVAPFGGTEGSLDVLLRTRGLTREVVLWVQTFTAAPLIVARTDLVATVPRRVAEAFSGALPLQLLPPPLPVPGFTCSQLWHRRTEADPAHQWLRRFVFDTVRAGGSRDPR